MSAKNTNPADVGTKWVNAMLGATQAYKDGVSSVTTSPTQLAAQQVQKYVQGVNDAVSSGRYQNGLNSVSLQSWQNSAINRGAARLASGAQASKSKMVNFLTNFLPAQQSIVQQADQMPTGTYQQRQAKANFVMDQTHALKGKFKQSNS